MQCFTVPRRERVDHQLLMRILSVRFVRHVGTGISINMMTSRVCHHSNTIIENRFNKNFI